MLKEIAREFFNVKNRLNKVEQTLDARCTYNASDITESQSVITDMDIQQIETELALTDLDLRILELEVNA